MLDEITLPAAPAQDETFTPPADWQDVPAGAVLPPGLEIRTSLDPGRTEVPLSPGEPAATPAIAAPAADVPPAIAELTGLGARFLVWKLETRNGEPTKVPCRPILGSPLRAETDNPATWGTYAEAQAALASGMYSGIGFVCRPEQDGIFVVDLDGCISPDGEISQWASDIVEQIDSFTEISPSGTGLKVYARGNPSLRFPAKTTKVDAPKVCKKDPQIEILINKYTTLTGDHFGGTPQTIEDASGYLGNMARWIAEDRTTRVREHSQPLNTPWTMALLMRAADVIPNARRDVTREQWNNMGMRFWAATNGSEDGLAAFEVWSAKSDKCSNRGTAQERWKGITNSPPTSYDINSLFKEARRYDPAFPDPASFIMEGIDFSGIMKQKPKAAEDARRVLSITTIDFTELPDVEPPRRSFLIEDWLPAGCMSSLYGPGGVGKSLLTQQGLTCIATGMDFLGFKVERAPVLGLFAEDDDDELKRRQWRINQAFGLSNRNLADLHIQGRAGLDNAMATFPGGEPRAEPLLEIIIKRMRELEARVVVLDNRAQMLLVNENDRAQATYAANLCASLCREVPNSSVLLLGHVAKAEGSEYSGSTAWDAVTRSRWWLRRADDCDNEMQAPELILERVKSNYAKPDSLSLAWTAEGVLRPAETCRMTGGERLAAELRKGAARKAFLDALDKLNGQQRPVSHSQQAKNYAPRLMHKLGMANGFTARELEQAMESLFADDRIAANQTIGRRSNRTPISGIARATDGTEPADDEVIDEAA